jgi:MFS family permease
MLISDSLSGLITLATALLLLTGQLEVWMIYLVSFLGSVFAAFQQPAYSASIVMLVPKDQLTRANSMIQMGQAIESLITPLLAGALFASIGMEGIILIDIVTYLLAVITLVLVVIPQPAKSAQDTQVKTSILKDVSFGWRYLAERGGLLGLLFYFAAVNFFFNLSAVMLGPLVLSFSSVTSMGAAQTVMGAGMLAGSVLMSVWGGPKNRKVYAVIGFISLATLGFFIAGLRPSLPLISVGTFVLTFFIPFASGPSSAIFAAKVAPEVQGRVFATRSMVSQSMMPLAFLLSGFLADSVFNPLLVPGGALADTFVGRWIGVGPGRGIGLMIICAGLVLTIISAAVFAHPRIRNIETDIPDAIPDAEKGWAEPGGQGEERAPSPV